MSKYSVIVRKQVRYVMEVEVEGKIEDKDGRNIIQMGINKAYESGDEWDLDDEDVRIEDCEWEEI